MLKLAPFNLQQNYENILSIIKNDQKNSLLEILLQDNIIQSINHQNSLISQFLFSHIADLFNIALDNRFNNQGNGNDQTIKSDDSKIEYDYTKITSNAREALVSLSINFPAQFSENPIFHFKMNQILNIINKMENNPQEKVNLDISEVKNNENNSNENKENSDQVIDNSIPDINSKLSIVLLSRIIFSLGKSENYSILASLSDDQEFFPKFCSLLGTHCAVYDTLFSLSNDDMPAVSLFFEDMDTTEILLEMMKQSNVILKKLLNVDEKDSVVQNDSEIMLNNYKFSIAYYNIDDIFRMQKRAILIINHLISNAEKESILIKNLSDKVDYLNFVFEELGLKSLSKDVAASSFSLLIRLHQISLSPTIVNKSSIFNPFMNSQKPSQQIDYDDDYDSYSDSDYDSNDCFDKISKKKNNKKSENSKRIKKVPLIQTFFENNAHAICKYVIDSKQFSISIEKALDILSIVLRSSENQDNFFNENENSNLLQAMIQKLADDFFLFPNCSILHTNFRKIFMLLLKIEEQRLSNSSEYQKSSLIANICNYFKEKIIQVLEQEHFASIDQSKEYLICQNEILNNVENISKDISLSKNIQDENSNEESSSCENNINEDSSSKRKERVNSDSKDEDINPNNNINPCSDSIEGEISSNNDINEKYSNFARYDFTKYCFWGVVVELADLVDSITKEGSQANNENAYWTKFIQNDVKRFKDITSHDYGGSVPLGTRTYGKILCVRSPSSSQSSGQKPRSFIKKASEKLNFGDDSDSD